MKCVFQLLGTHSVQLLTVICISDVSRLGLEQKLFIMLLLSLLWGVVDYKFIVLEKQFQFHFLRTIGDHIVFMKKSRKIDKLGYILCVYWISKSRNRHQKAWLEVNQFICLQDICVQIVQLVNFLKPLLKVRRNYQKIKILLKKKINPMTL